MVRAARVRGGSLDREQLRAVFGCGRSGRLFVAPSFIADFVAAYLEARGTRPQELLDLWAGNGWLLPPLAEAFELCHAVGVVADQGQLELARLLDPGGRIDWRLEEPRAVLAETRRSLDVVLGIPPWHWQPERTTLPAVQGMVELTDDPANVALLTASMQLGPGGIGFFVVGPGFVMRPGKGTVFANLSHFGLGLESLHWLPRGIFTPDSGTGRLLLALSRDVSSAPLVGELTPTTSSSRIRTGRRQHV